MPYTHKSLAVVWLIGFGLFALSGFGLVTGFGLLPLVLIGLAAPALILRSPTSPSTISQSNAAIAADDRDRLPPALGRIPEPIQAIP